MPEQMPDVSPELFFETATAFQKSAALKAAVDLDLFTAVGKGATSVEAAVRCNVSERGIRILCDYLVIQGFLLKEGDVYRCTADTAFFLTKNSPAYLGSAVEFLMAEPHVAAFTKLTDAVHPQPGSRHS